MRIVAGEWRGRALTAPPGRDTRPTADMDRSTLISLMVGREMSAIYSHEPHVQPHEALAIHGLTCARAGVRDVTFSVHAGDVSGSFCTWRGSTASRRPQTAT